MFEAQVVTSTLKCNNEADGLRLCPHPVMPTAPQVPLISMFCIRFQIAKLYIIHPILTTQI